MKWEENHMTAPNDCIPEKMLPFYGKKKSQAERASQNKRKAEVLL